MDRKDTLETASYLGVCVCVCVDGGGGAKEKQYKSVRAEMR